MVRRRNPPTHLIAFLLFLSLPGILHGQQPYSGQTITNCGVNTISTSVQGYLCGAQSPPSDGSATCDTYLTFHPQPPYQTPLSISSLLSADPSNISRANSLPPDSTSTPFPPSTTKILVPIRCSCSGAGFYQSNASYTVRAGNTLLTIAQNTFQGLSTCQALASQNQLPSTDLVFAQTTIVVPLRCACPSAAQAAEGVEYLLSYLIDSGDDVSAISDRFGVDVNRTLAANGLTFEKPTVYPLTTLLVPLKTEPTISQLASAPPLSPISPPSSFPPAPSDGKKSRTGVYVGVAVGTVVVLALLAAGFLLYYRRGKKKNTLGKPILPSKNAHKLFDTSTTTGTYPSSLSIDNILSEISDLKRSLTQYKFKELQLATNDFSSDCLIGESVYRGNFNGDFAAIKIMNRDAFKEIDILNKFNHSNLIGLSGSCFHEGRWYLVYEYAENGPLSDWLFDNMGSKVLSWIQRVQIALDVANGLNYLHNFTEPSYVHKDVRSTNILLDANFKAKIVNFGLARSLPESETDQPVLTRHIVGTHGYMSPEYLEHGLVTPKLDVYAFGVLMMEMITGKDVGALHREEGGAFWTDGVFNHEMDVDEDLIRNYMDPLLQGKYASIPATIMARLAAQCMKRDMSIRPNMADIVQALSGVLAASMSSILTSSSSASENFSVEVELRR